MLFGLGVIGVVRRAANGAGRPLLQALAQAAHVFATRQQEALVAQFVLLLVTGQRFASQAQVVAQLLYVGSVAGYLSPTLANIFVACRKALPKALRMLQGDEATLRLREALLQLRSVVARVGLTVHVLLVLQCRELVGIALPLLLKGRQSTLQLLPFLAEFLLFLASFFVRLFLKA